MHVSLLVITCLTSGFECVEFIIQNSVKGDRILLSTTFKPHLHHQDPHTVLTSSCACNCTTSVCNLSLFVPVLQCEIHCLNKTLQMANAIAFHYPHIHNPVIHKSTYFSAFSSWICTWTMWLCHWELCALALPCGSHVLYRTLRTKEQCEKVTICVCTDNKSTVHSWLSLCGCVCL